MAELVLPPEIVFELRRGLLVAMGTSAERLAVLTLPGRLTHLPSYESSLWTIDATRTALSQVGAVPPRRQSSVSLAENEHPLLLYRALRSRHELLESLRRDAAISAGRQYEPAEDDALGQCVASLGRRLAGGPREREERRHLARSNTAYVDL